MKIDPHVSEAEHNERFALLMKLDFNARLRYGVIAIATDGRGNFSLMANDLTAPEVREILERLVKELTPKK